MTLDRLTDAQKCGIDFLLSKHKSDGHWSDFELPVGSSTAWITAYVIGILHHYPESSINARLGGEWLLRNYRDGWGYNETVPVDCDSTAWGIIALVGAGIPLPAESEELLGKFADATGLFRTFSNRGPEDNWGSGHLDVTVVALRALLKSRSTYMSLITRTINRILEAGENGEWRAYWWDDQMYAISQSLETLDELLSWHRRRDAKFLSSEQDNINPELHSRIYALRNRYRAEIQNRSAFDDPYKAALLANAWVFSDGEDDFPVELMSFLLDSQEPDGRWRGAPKLRVTYPHVSCPWADKNPGPLFADDQDVFTTASVVNALENVRQQFVVF